MSKKIIFLTVLAALISGSIVFLGFTPKENTTPREVYRVYLAGESIGLIESKDELEKYIDQEQSHLKEEYKVDKVYAPKDLDIVSEYTYDTKISSAEEIYNKIKDLSPLRSVDIVLQSVASKRLRKKEKQFIQKINISMF